MYLVVQFLLVGQKHILEILTRYLLILRVRI
jgi:hypothetical protein